MLLIPSLGFTLKGKMRAKAWSLVLSLTRRAFLSYAPRNFLAVDPFTPISVPSYRFPDAVQAEMSALGVLRKIMLFSSKPGICKNQKCLLSDYKKYPSFKSKANECIPACKRAMPSSLTSACTLVISLIQWFGQPDTYKLGWLEAKTHWFDVSE